MNYAVVILTLVFALALGYWLIHGRTYYTGPRSHAHGETGGMIVSGGSDTVLDPEKLVNGPPGAL